MPPNASEDLLQEVTHVRTEKTASIVEYSDEEDEGVTECDRNEYGYGAADALFTSLVVAPQVVSVWRGTWGLMELNGKFFPYAQSYIMGIVLHVSFALIRSQLLSRSKGAWGTDGKAGRWLRERILSRVYTYIFILACIMHWRGGWGLLDMLVATLLPAEDDPHRPVLIAGLTILFYLGSTAIRSSRNILASPYFLVTDGKEATYIFTTRFQKKVSNMRDSTFESVGRYIGSEPAEETFLELFDMLFSGFIVGPLGMIYWKSAWSLMDLYILPDYPILSAIVTAVYGLLFGLLLCVFQDRINKWLTPDIGWPYYVLTRLYTCFAGIVNVGACRGVWNILDITEFDPDLTVLTTVVTTLTLLYLKGFRNTISAPFCITVDSPEGYSEAPTFYKQSSKETVLYILDCIFSVTVVGSLVVFVWRGSWALLDIFLFPDDPVKSDWTSLIVGYALVVFTFALQAPMRWAASRLQGATRLLLADAYHLISFIATVNVWRGVWGLLDIYFFPDTPKLSNWCSHIISLVLLILLNCSNSILVRGVYIDAEEPAGDCVVFPCHYLRHFFHKERTKKRHKRALVAAAAAAAATRKIEEASVPLQIPEEKV